MRNVNVFVPEAAECFVESADCLNCSFSEGHVATAQPFCWLILAGMICRTNVEAAPIDFVSIGSKTEQPVHRVARDVVVTGMVHESTNTTELWIVVEPDHFLNPP